MIIEKARELGIALSTSPEFKAMQAAREALNDDTTLSAMLEEYSEKQKSILSMLEESDADTGAIQGLSAEMDRLQAALASSPVFNDVMETQSAFQGLMNRVNREIGACIGAPMEEHEGCSGSCENCDGCKH